jgi:hypothetical protein
VNAALPIPCVDGPQCAHALLSEYADLPRARQEVQVNPTQFPVTSCKVSVKKERR